MNIKHQHHSLNSGGTGSSKEWSGATTASSSTAPLSSASSSSSSRYAIVCKYFKSGTCKLGDSCRFSHTYASSSSSSSPSSPALQANPSQQPPSLSLASDSKKGGASSNNFVNNTSTNTQSKKEGATAQQQQQSNLSPFLQAALQSTNGSVQQQQQQQMNVSNSSNSPPLSGNSSLNSSLNGLSLSDEEEFISMSCRSNPSRMVGRRPFLQLVVLYATDPRVMRFAKEVQNSFLDGGIDVHLKTEDNNQSIKTENLAEIITSSKADCLVVLGDRNLKNKSCQAKRRGKLVEMEIEEVINCIWTEWTQLIPREDESITDEQTFNLLEKHCKLRHVKDRLSKLKTSIHELKDLKIPSKRNITDPSSFLDEKVASRLTAAQKSVMRFHQQVVEAIEYISEMPFVSHTEKLSSTRGSIVGPDALNSNDQKPVISETSRDKLLNQLNRILPKIEALGDTLSEYGAPLSDAYFDDYHNASMKSDFIDPDEAVVLKPNQWRCTACTYINTDDFKNCAMCDTPSQQLSNDGEWSTPGQKKSKKLTIQTSYKKIEPSPQPTPSSTTQSQQQESSTKKDEKKKTDIKQSEQQQPKLNILPSTTTTTNTTTPSTTTATINTAPTTTTTTTPNIITPPTSIPQTILTNPQPPSINVSPNLIGVQLPSAHATPYGSAFNNSTTIVQPILQQPPPPQPLQPIAPQVVLNNEQYEEEYPSLMSATTKGPKTKKSTATSSPQHSNNPSSTNTNSPPPSPSTNHLISHTSTANNISNSIIGGTILQSPSKSKLPTTPATISTTNSANTIINPGINHLNGVNINGNSYQQQQQQQQQPLYSNLPQNGSLLSKLQANMTTTTQPTTTSTTPHMNGTLNNNNTNNNNILYNNSNFLGTSTIPSTISTQPSSTASSSSSSQYYNIFSNNNNFGGWDSFLSKNNNATTTPISTSVTSSSVQENQLWFSNNSYLTSQANQPPSSSSSVNSVSSLFAPDIAHFGGGIGGVNGNTPRNHQQQQQQDFSTTNHLYSQYNGVYNGNSNSNNSSSSSSSNGSFNFSSQTPNGTSSLLSNNSSSSSSSHLNNQTSSTGNNNNNNNHHQNNFVSPHIQQQLLLQHQLLSHSNAQEQFDKEKQKVREAVLEKYKYSHPPQRPCCYCGEESILECYNCAKIGFATYFCTKEHQSLMWKEHLRVHQMMLSNPSTSTSSNKH